MVRSLRSRLVLTFALAPAVACLAGCARAPAPPVASSAAPPAPPSAAVDDREGPLPPYPPHPPSPKTIDHPELRPVTVIARDVTDGIETLVAATGSEISCRGLLERGAEVRVEGAPGAPAPYSGWFENLPGRKIDGGQTIPEGYLVVRRAVPPRGTRQTAHLYLPPPCAEEIHHQRFALPEADAGARDPRARAYWADAFARRVHDHGAWGRFAVNRIRELFPEPAPPQPAAARSGKRKPAAAPARPRVIAGVARSNPPRRRAPNDLARLMETTTGMASLQETLQLDRTLVAGPDDAPSVPLGTLKPPPLAVHPFPAMLAALRRPVPAEPLAVAAPADFYFVRFRSIAHLYRLRDELDSGLWGSIAALDRSFADRDLSGRYEAELGVKQGALGRLLGPSVIDELALVGSDPYWREGTDLTLVFRVKAPALFDAALAGILAEHAAAHGGVTTSTVDRGGVTVRVARSADGAVRQHRAAVGGFELVSNSPGAIARVIAAVQGRGPRLADEPDFRYMLARDAGAKGDVLAFLGDRFIAEVVGPRQKILEARRQLALAELSRPGYAALLFGWLRGRPPAAIDELVASGVLRREELAHAAGEKLDWAPGRGARSSWGRPAALTPLIDLPAPERVSPAERDAYAIFSAEYQSYWRTYLDPIAVRIGFDPARGGLQADLRILPVISGTEYAEMGRTVGRARVALGEGRRGARTVLGIGPDAGLRRLLSRSLNELPLVGHLAIDWLGSWAVVGIDDRARPKPPATRREIGEPGWSSEQLVNDLVELPLYAGVEVRNLTAAAAFLAGARHALDRAAPGVVEWNEAGKERGIPFVAVRAKMGGAGAWSHLALYYAFCKSSLFLSLGEAALRRRIAECLDGQEPRTLAADGKEGPQWIVESDIRERGPAWAWLVRLGTQAVGAFSTGSAQRSAEVVLRGAPGLTGSGARVLARETFGAAPVTPEGNDYLLAEDGIHDPARGLRLERSPFDTYEGSYGPSAPFVRFLRAIIRVRTEVAFDDEAQPAGGRVDADRPRSLHVTVRLPGERR